MSDDLKQRVYAKAWHGEKPYDSNEEIRFAKACRLIISLAGGEKSTNHRTKVLDVGCGVGPLRKWLPAEAFELTGVDISQEAIEKAADSYDHAQVIDAELPWPFEPASFDALHMGAVMEHVADWHGPLNMANRVLTDEGLIVISIPNLGYWKEIRRLIRGKHPHWLRDMQHVHGYTAGFFKTLLKIHGFDVIELAADRVNLPLLPNSDFICKKFARLGSVLIFAAKLHKRVRIEDSSQEHCFRETKPSELRSIEVIKP